MKKLFPTFYHLTEEEKQHLFESKDCYFVFDTNALLDIYRLGKDTAEKVLNILEKYKERIKIPKHVALEYHNHMLDIITEMCAMYDGFLKQGGVEDLLNKLTNTFNLDGNSSLRRKMVKHLKPAISNLLDDIKGEHDYMLNQFRTWELQNKLSDALGFMVLSGFNEEELLKIEEEGKERFSKKIPPGYMDSKDKDTNIYGDYIIWREILKYAKERQCSVIFIGRDMKEDWLQKLHGMNCGPRQELLNEFTTYSPNGKFHIYTLDQFLEYANKENQVLNESELSEVKELVSPKVVEKNESPTNKISTPTKKSFPDDDKSEEEISSFNQPGAFKSK